MKDVGMLFKPRLIQAMIAGTKTQTRRIMKPQPSRYEFGNIWYRMPSGGESLNCYDWPIQIGDRIMARESYWVDKTTGEFKWYANPFFTPDRELHHCKLRPSLHMPYSLCRVKVIVTDIRIERIQDISEADATVEGAPLVDIVTNEELTDPSKRTYGGSRKHGFMLSWQSLYPGSWERNDWVWVYSWA